MNNELIDKMKDNYPFSHLLLTRFNVKSKTTKAGIIPDKAWLNHRFKLFAQFCYPSVYSQSNQNFKWLIFFDTETPESFKEKINEYSQWENCIPIYTDLIFDDDGSFPEELRKKIIRYINPKSKYLITTRIDNDDAICKQYIDMIQNNFNEQKCEAINFVYGYQFYKGKIYLRFTPQGSHFISLIENYEGDSFKTVFCTGHGGLSTIATVKNIKSKPAWLEVIHERNVVNRYENGFPMPIKKLINDFSIKIEGFSFEENLLALWSDRILFFLNLPSYIFYKLTVLLKWRIWKIVQNQRRQGDKNENHFYLKASFLGFKFLSNIESTILKYRAKF
jgi:hypothetical protein